MILNPYRFAVAGPPGRYWVGGTNTWNSTVGTKWATTSGGAGGATVPTATDDVYFDANSGAVTVTLGATGLCKAINFTGFTGTFTGSFSLRPAGNVTLVPAMTWTLSSNMLFNVNSATVLLDTAGKTIFSLTHSMVGGTLTLVSDLLVTGAFTHNNGTFNGNDFDVTAATFLWGVSATRVVNLGSGTYTITSGTAGANCWSTDVGTNLTMNCDTSTVKYAPTGSGIRLWDSHNQTYFNLWITGTAHQINFHGNATFNGEFRIDPSTTVDRQCWFESGMTYTLKGAVNINGNATRRIVLTRKDASAIFNFARPSGGPVVCTYLTLSYSNATPAATWTAKDSTDGGNNTGWIFPYACVAVRLNDTAEVDYFKRDAVYVGGAVSTVGILSYWIRFYSGYALSLLDHDGNGGVRVSMVNDVTVDLLDASWNTICSSRTTGVSAGVAQGWMHVLVSWSFPLEKIYISINGSTGQSTYTPPLVTGSVNFGLINPFLTTDPNMPDYSSYLVKGSIAEFYLNTATYLDTTQAANWQKFRTVGGGPAYLGATGQLPTGASPLVYLRLLPAEAVSAFAVNRGTGGNFTQVGTPIVDATLPNA